MSIIRYLLDISCALCGRVQRRWVCAACESGEDYEKEKRA